MSERLYKLRQLEAISATLDTLNEALVAGMPAHVRAVAGRMKIATMAAIQQALEYPDAELATCFPQGCRFSPNQPSGSPTLYLWNKMQNFVAFQHFETH